MQSFDHAMFLWFNAGPDPTPALLALARFLSATAPSLAAAGLLATAVAGGPGLRESAMRACLSMALAWMAVSALRRGFPMPRPATQHLGWQWLERGQGSSFPSHHAAGAFACWCALALSPALQPRRGVVLASLAVAGGIAWSRLYLGVHFPKDLLAGGLLGCAAAITVSAAAHRIQRMLRMRRVRRARHGRRLAA